MYVANLFYLAFITDIVPVIDILKEKGVGEVINVNCHNEDAILWHKYYNENNIRASKFDMEFGVTWETLYNKRIGIVLNASCSSWKQAVTKFTKYYFKSSYVWIIITRDIYLTVTFLSNLSIEIDSDVTVMLHHNGVYNLYEVFHTDYSSGILKINTIGYWNNTLHMKKAKRRDINGTLIRCTVVVTEDIIDETFDEYLNKPRNTKVDSLHKLKFYALLTYIRDMYNLRYEFQRTNSWGYPRNGSFDGVVGALQYEQADIGGSPLFFRGDRAKLIDYVAETWTSRQCFILRHPKHLGGIFTIYTRPLAARVWYCILLILAISGILLSLMLKMKITNAQDNGPTDSSFSLALLFVWSTICQQGMSINRNSTAVKMVVFVAFVYALTLYQYYNATVVSTLLREPPKNIRTLNDLLRSNLRAGAENVLYTKDYFKRTTDLTALKMYRMKISPDHQSNFYTAEEGMALVKQGGFAFHVDSIVAYRIMRSTFSERELCEAHEVLLYPPQKMGLVVRKSSPFKEHFTYGVRKILESGLMRRLQSVWDEPKPACVHTPDTSVISVSIREFSTALMALTIGSVTALIVLLGEIVYYKFNRDRRLYHVSFLH